MIGPVFKDEELFATKEVFFVGQVIGIIVATTHDIARNAARLVKISYEKLPFVLTIEEAIEKESFFDIKRKLVNGMYTSDKSLSIEHSGLNFIEGTCRMAGQEHFYLGMG